MKHRADAPHKFRARWAQWWCSLRHAGGHPLDCNYSKRCDGNHRCTNCGWTGR